MPFPNFRNKHRQGEPRRFGEDLPRRGPAMTGRHSPRRVPADGQELERAFLIARLAPRHSESILDIGCAAGEDLEEILRLHRGVSGALPKARSRRRPRSVDSPVHQLRHTFACRWLERGGSLEALRQILGHSTVRTTERYGRIADDLVRAEANRVYGAATTVAKTVASGVPDGVESQATQ